MSQSKKSAGAFRTISEVADELDVQQHVLRFWETKFSQIRPLKRGGGRRYYRPEDIELLKSIHNLLYSEGYTIKGVQKLFREQGKKNVVEGNLGTPTLEQDHVMRAEVETGRKGLNDHQRESLQDMLSELNELRNIVSAPQEQD